MLPSKAYRHLREQVPSYGCGYTDGSGIEGQVGAAAVAPERGLGRMAYMGTDETSTVYAAKLQDLTMMMSIVSAVKMMKSEL